MTFARRVCFFAVIAACADAQRVDFECQPLGPVPPLAGPADCDGLVANSNPAGQVTVVNAPNCQMPAGGSRYALLVAKEPAAASVPVGTVLPRPFAPALTELRIGLGGALLVQFQYSFHQYAWGFIPPTNPAAVNDGFDISVVDAGGNRLKLLARGDAVVAASPIATCPPVEFGFGVFDQPLPPGSYLSFVAYNAGAAATDSQLLVDSVQITRIGFDFECQPGGSSFAPSWDCQGVAGRTGSGGSATASSAAQCGMPSEGAQYARLTAGGYVPGFTTGSTLTRPVPADFSTVYVSIPPGSTSVAFDYAFVNLEGANQTSYVDGFDVSIVDAAGNRVLLLLKGDVGASGAGCNGVQRFGTAIPAATGDTYLSFAVFNGTDDLFDSELLVDYVCFGPGMQLRYSSPLGPGSLAARIDCGPPGQLYFTPTTIAPGNFPHGYFGGVDISLYDAFVQFMLGPPFIGVLDSNGSAYMPAFVGLPSGLTLYANVFSNIFSTTSMVGGIPVSYAIP